MISRGKVFKENIHNAIDKGLCTYRSISVEAGCSASYVREVVMDDSGLFSKMLKNKNAKSRIAAMDVVKQIKPLRDKGLIWSEVTKLTGIYPCSYTRALEVLELGSLKEQGK